MKREKPFTVVQLVAIDETGDSYYRMRWPAAHVAAQAPSWRILNVDARASERFLWGEQADLLVLYQSNDIDLLPLLQKRRKLGKKTLVEYNDNFYAPPAASPVASAWSSPLIWQAYERFMNEADAVVVTGKALQQLFAEKTNKPIHILPNHLPEAPPPFAKLWPDPKDGIHIGWAGSLGHMADFLAILPVLDSLFVRYPQLSLSLMGNEALPGFVRLPPHRVRFSKWGSMKEYFAFLKGFHIGLAPLLRTPYNDCRSDIKAVEISASGSLPILSDAVPYQDFLAATSAPRLKHFDDLNGIISRYVENFSLAREDAERCYQYVCNERIGKSHFERLELYEELLPNTPATHHWPYPAGSHEIVGTPQAIARDAAVLAKAQELVQQKKRRAAQTVIEQELSQNPFHPGFALTEIKLLAGTDGKKQLEQKLREYQKRFPDDLRFAFLRISSETNEPELENNWLELLDRLVRSSAVYQEFFAANVITLYCQQLQRHEQLISQGESLMEIYPGSAALRFALAEFYEKHGNYERSLSHFRWLLEARLMHGANSEFFSRIDSNYLRTWKEALEARLELTIGELNPMEGFPDEEEN